MLLAVWLTGLVLFLLMWISSALLLRTTRAGRRSELVLSDVTKVIAVCVGLCCGLLTLLLLID
jgi:hypothetical protein